MSKNHVVRKYADRHQMLVATHTAVPVGTAKWLGRRMPQTKCPAVGRGHEKQYRLPMAGFPSRPIPFPSHFETPNGVSVWLATNI